jgi:hypothetical protein
MNVRPILLLSALLLSGATFAGAATPDAPAIAPQAALEQAAPSCGASLSQQEALPFASLTPAPSPKSISACGPCTPTPCQGKTINASCSYTTRTGFVVGKCHADSVCSGSPVSTLCICRNGPEV